MLSLSVHKNIDYSTPVIFRPLGTQTTTKPITKKPTTVATKPSTQNKIITPTKKPTTVATTLAKAKDIAKPITKIITAVADVKKIESSVAKAMADTPAIKADVKEVTKAEEKKTPPIAQALDIQQEIVTPSFASSSHKATKEHSKASEGTALIPDNAHVSHNYRQVEALRMQAQLQKEIVQKWKPPIGVSPDCTCDVSFFINTAGGIENIKMVKPSGVMMFDISARQTLCAIKMPHWTYGKTLTINFKQ